MTLPARKPAVSRRGEKQRRSPAHRKWVAGHACAVCGTFTAIECAHVRTGTDGGVGVKPSDAWTISLCRDHHAEQHQIGERAFEQRHSIDMKALAAEFARKSPHRAKLEER
jgi:hypothetical protein